jgi:hypothetical protein
MYVFNMPTEDILGHVVAVTRDGVHLRGLNPCIHHGQKQPFFPGFTLRIAANLGNPARRCSSSEKYHLCNSLVSVWWAMAEQQVN